LHRLDEAEQRISVRVVVILGDEELVVKHLHEDSFHFVIGADVHSCQLSPTVVAEVEIVVHFARGAHTDDEQSMKVTPIDSKGRVFHREFVDHDQRSDQAGAGLPNNTRDLVNCFEKCVFRDFSADKK